MKKNKRILYLFNISLFILFSEIFGHANPKEIDTEREVFPILNYDTDVGFGYGLKGFFYNFLEREESFDITAYNSTKGERWYQFIFSSPDMQRRQGKKYNMAMDFIIDYDKYINFNYYSEIDEDYFYYFFNDSLVKKSEQYVREPIEVKLLFSKAFTNDFISEVGLQFRNISCYNFDSKGILQYKLPSEVRHISLLFNFRIDTRENFINPQKGVVAQINNEYAIDTKGNGENFYKIDFIFQSYLNILHPNVTFANRIKLQGLLGIDDKNYQNLLYLGGNNSIRGLPQSRYLSKSTILLNEEIRFPIWWRFGGIAGIDLGNSTSTPKWIVYPVIGLRFYLDNFLVRFDVGFSKDDLGLYFNFGHIF